MRHSPTRSHQSRLASTQAEPRFIRHLRRLLLCTLALALTSAGGTLFAQEQEKMIKRWLEPDEHKTANIEAFKKGFDGKQFKSRKNNPLAKEFYGTRQYQGKDFTTSDYNAVRRATVVEKKYAAKEANTEGRGNAKRLLKQHDTSSYSVKDARDASKTASAKTYATRETRWRGSSQDQIDREGPSAMASIQKDGSFRKLETIDDIRQLLNELD